MKMASKDPEHAQKLLGCRVELKWSSGRWYRGTIVEYNETRRKHKILYDDSDVRFYDLTQYVVRFVNDQDEWEIVNDE